MNDKRVRAVSFTGGLQGGRAVAAACATDFKSLQLELGGNNALVVLPDADVDKVADGIVAGLTTLNGQWCRALGRLIVHETIAEQVVAAALRKLQQVKAGDALSAESQLGPLANEAHKGRNLGAVCRCRAQESKAHEGQKIGDNRARTQTVTSID